MRKLRTIYRSCKSAYANLAAMGVRSSLTMLGIVIGTGSVVAMVSGGQMATEASLENIRALGTNLMSITFTTPPTLSNKQQPLSLDDAMEIKSASPSIQLFSPYMQLYFPAVYKGITLNAPVIAATQDLAEILHIRMHLGRFISDYDQYQLFCVIGFQLYHEMSLNVASAIGSRLHIGNNIFTVVGVMKPWPENSFFLEKINNAIIIPINTVRLLNQNVDISDIVMRLNSQANIEDTEATLERYVQKTLPNKKLTLHSPKELVQNALRQSRIFYFLLGLIGSISLLVGGIGIMNTMLVSVLERRQEIGIRLTLGATPSAIQRMFLSEAILLSMTGGILGVLLGIFCAYVISLVTNWPFLFLFWPPLVGFGVSFITGVFFGYYPAYQAANMNIIDTLRTE